MRNMINFFCNLVLKALYSLFLANIATYQEKGQKLNKGLHVSGKF